MVNKDMEKELVMLAGAVAMSIMLDSFQLIAKEIQKMLFNCKRVIAIMCLEELLESSKNDSSLAHFFGQAQARVQCLNKSSVKRVRERIKIGGK